MKHRGFLFYLSEFRYFIRHRKLLWLSPIILLLLLLSLFIFFAESAALSPYLYMLF